jgi:hypothetical protein
MTKFAPAAILAGAMLLLAGCGHHDHESDDATPSNVEMPAADLPAGPPSLAAPPPAHDPDADASAAALSARAAATTDAEDAASVAEQVRAARAAADADQQPGSSGDTGTNHTPPPQ